MTLTAKQKKALETVPPAEAIKSREEGGSTLSYLEGWYVIQEANRIFGTEHWDRITLSTQCVWQGRHEGRAACSYSARIRLCIRTKDETIVREGSGIGHGRGATPGEAHGQALKAAETDATKRALATLGAPFGLTLYEAQPRTETQQAPENASERAAKTSPSIEVDRTSRGSRPWILRDASGEAVSAFSSPILACSALRRAIDGSGDAATLEANFTHNKRFLARLASEKPNLRDHTERHYSEILSALYQAKLKRLSEKTESRLSGYRNGAIPARLSGSVPAD